MTPIAPMIRSRLFWYGAMINEQPATPNRWLSAPIKIWTPSAFLLASRRRSTVSLVSSISNSERSHVFQEIGLAAHDQRAGAVATGPARQAARHHPRGQFVKLRLVPPDLL